VLPAMFTSFTGNTRRPRQVNLGGRKTHAFGSTGSGSGSQAALDRAQQDRAQRQREREIQKAARTIQRVWRGHRSRGYIGSLLRQEWDAAESPTAGSPTPYSSEQEALSQLQRLLRFANTRNESDFSRIRVFCRRQVETVQSLGIEAIGAWPSAYLDLQRIVLRILDRQANHQPARDGLGDFVNIIKFLAEQIPAETAENGPQYFHTLVHALPAIMSPDDGPTNPTTAAANLEAVLPVIVAPLNKVTGYTLNAYEAFGFEFLRLRMLGGDTTAPFIINFRDSLANAINYKLLASALATRLKEHGLQSRQELADVDSRLNFLGLFIYFHRYAHNFQSSEAYAVHKNFVTVVSLLLNSLPTNTIEGSGSDEDKPGVEEITVNDFLKEQILSLVNQEGIGNLLAESSHSSEATEDEKVEEARQLANYALALLRFFPRRGDEIRMWLYIGPSNTQSGTGRKLPAIKYFWQASKRSSVFGTIARDSRAAVDLLRPKTAQSNGVASSASLSANSFWQAPRQEIDLAAVRADEWRVILVFLELYTFVLKVTDDEEFFSGGSLPLADVKDLTTFLKNLGFTLYFNASDINESDERDTASSGISFFSPQAAEVQQHKQAAESSLGGVAGLTLDYVKGLVTGLVRMVYERDSRRKFLPDDHWLMTSRFDMTGFIPAVVEEEESRHRILEEDMEDMEDLENDEDDFDDTPQLIGTGRTQQQRRLERLQRQQRKASRRRYLQAVAPRLEILQNMPFFIPFTTRVQIFREFVTLDMVSMLE
jgi:ubiquitin-protein ligase E3 C